MTLLYLSYALTLINAVIRAVFYYNLSLAYGHGLGYFLGTPADQGFCVLVQ